MSQPWSFIAGHYDVYMGAAGVAESEGGDVVFGDSVFLGTTKSGIGKNLDFSDTPIMVDEGGRSFGVNATDDGAQLRIQFNGVEYEKLKAAIDTRLIEVAAGAGFDLHTILNVGRPVTVGLTRSLEFVPQAGLGLDGFTFFHCRLVTNLEYMLQTQNREGPTTWLVYPRQSSNHAVGHRTPRGGTMPMTQKVI